MADEGGFLSKYWCSGFGGGAKMEDKDFGEEDVWGVVANNEKEKEKEEYSGSKSMRVCKDSSAWRINATPRKIPRANNTLLPSSDNAQVAVQGSSSSSSSAPMDIPDWSKIYGKSCKKGSRGGYGHGEDQDNGDASDDEEEDCDRMPPHEWLARRLARSQISSFSMCEGMGRTLKGRDLSKVRNAILTKTGFIE